MGYLTKLLAPALALGMNLGCATVKYEGPQATVSLYKKTTDNILKGFEKRLDEIRSYQLQTSVLTAEGKDIEGRIDTCEEMKVTLAEDYNDFVTDGNVQLIKDSIATTPGIMEYGVTSSNNESDFKKAQDKVVDRLKLGMDTNLSVNRNIFLSLSFLNSYVI